MHAPSPARAKTVPHRGSRPVDPEHGLGAADLRLHYAIHRFVTDVEAAIRLVDTASDASDLDVDARPTAG